jgi:predicted thioredoxin/glutaredoxin
MEMFIIGESGLNPNLSKIMKKQLDHSTVNSAPKAFQFGKQFLISPHKVEEITPLLSSQVTKNIGVSSKL